MITYFVRSSGSRKMSGSLESLPAGAISQKYYWRGPIISMIMILSLNSVAEAKAKVSNQAVVTQIKEYANKGEHAKAFALAKHADQDDPAIQTLLGLCYLKGNGVEKNLPAAGKLFRKAAEQGHAGAKSALDKLLTY